MQFQDPGQLLLSSAGPAKGVCLLVAGWLTQVLLQGCWDCLFVAALVVKLV